MPRPVARPVPVGVAVACLVAATLFWAINILVGAAVLPQLGPTSLTFLRWSIALLPLVVLAQLIERPDWRAVLRRWRMLTLLSLLGVTGYSLALYWALTLTTPVSAGLITAINPAVIALGAAVLLRERLGARKVVGLLLGLLGIVLVVTKGDPQALLGRGVNPGDLVMLITIAVWTVYTLLSRRLTDVPPITATAAQAAVAVAVSAPLAAATGLRLPATTESLIGLLVIGLLPSVGSYLLWNLALRSVSASTAGISLNLITVFTVVIGVALGATLGPIEAIGGVLVLAGVLLAVVPARSAATVT